MNYRRHRLKSHPRRGSTLVLAAVFLVLMLAMIGFAVDLGYVVLVRTQLQVAADSAAIAATAANMESPIEEVVATAAQYAGYHAAGGKSLELNPADVKLGVWDFNSRRFNPSAWSGNAVRVTTRRDSTSNGESALFFVRALGIDSVGLKTEAIAALVDNFSGFHPPSTGENLPILPFAVDKASCDDLFRGVGTDNWTWNAETGDVTRGGDGVAELNFYPQDTGAPGNRGTVDIGRDNNSTADLRRQILEGVSAEDLSYHGGKLELDNRGELELGADPGISAGMKNALEAIKGQGRIITVFSRVTGSGNNAEYTIVGFAGVRIMEVELTGGDKRVMIQPAKMVVLGGIPGTAEARTSDWLFSPVCLVR